MLKQQVLVLAAFPYRMTNESTGEVINEGTTVRSVYSSDLAAFDDPRGNLKGYKPAKSSHDYSFFAEKFGNSPVPGLYEATMNFSVDAKGKANLTPVDYTFVCPIAITKQNAKFSMPSVEK